MQLLDVGSGRDLAFMAVAAANRPDLNRVARQGAVVADVASPGAGGIHLLLIVVGMRVEVGCRGSGPVWWESWRSRRGSWLGYWLVVMAVRVA
jgi:hypothetical protein